MFLKQSLCFLLILFYFSYDFGVKQEAIVQILNVMELMLIGTLTFIGTKLDHQKINVQKYFMDQQHSPKKNLSMLEML